MGDLQLRDLGLGYRGGIPASLTTPTHTGKLAGTRETVDCHRTKGPMGMAAERTESTCRVSAPHLSAQLSPQTPDSHFRV